MSEADYLDDCQMLDLYDHQRRSEGERFCVISGDRIVFVGSRASCWDYKRKMGGYVQPYDGL